MRDFRPELQPAGDSDAPPPGEDPRGSAQAGRRLGQPRPLGSDECGRQARQLKEDLAKEWVLVRYFDKPGLENCIRISAGRPEDTDRLVQALKKL
jgi:hypothetical protein